MLASNRKTSDIRVVKRMAHLFHLSPHLLQDTPTTSFNCRVLVMTVSNRTDMAWALTHARRSRELATDIEMDYNHVLLTQ